MTRQLFFRFFVALFMLVVAMGCGTRTTLVYYKPDVAIQIKEIVLTELELKNTSILDVPKDVVSNVIIENLKLAYLKEGIDLRVDSKPSENIPEMKMVLLGKKNDFMEKKEYFSLIYKVYWKGENIFYLIQDFDVGDFFLVNSKLNESIVESARYIKNKQ